MTRRAIDLAEAGRGRVSPSPLVGCVVVSNDGEIVGEGAYIFSEVTHAEIYALNEAGERARGGTAYVSLEPHAHHGRTPPCTEALIKAGIKRVVCPMEDPNPLVSGKGFQELESAGIEVVRGILKDVAEKQNEKFICWHRNRRPFVHLKSAMSVDGRVATKTGDSKWITSASARQYGQQLRYEYDAILVGADTVRADDPALTDRTGKPRDRDLLRVVLDSSLRTDPGSRVVSTAPEHPTLFVAGSEGESKAEEIRGSGAEVAVIQGGPRNVSVVLDELYTRQITSVIVEGGPSVAGSFVESGLVDKFTFFLAPKIIGGEAAPAAIGGEGPSALTEAIGLRDMTFELVGPDLMITAYPSE
ncbi:MAG: bifunctional diaminohydroxyphosphoribosylaminopyrimidine deaminase/5-amino-6-(5-phosphoribosylamino)uracil reductase RibD [Acidobacteria bacterium]|nr:MAG: bifunctional diaminohydroxyphosphoribosylaminopyrimidine deaminase/5-amino-6-(5-phosphoribosylamino)uracil reductase RibD [Acidobacteriota bacterium]REK03093.1 MAG: bifunctional diaminohydroxyphosphoribosylaminopyrimidine deaminase/5-amino-6-(5-phosphoribosylamino)uracil reductase RibD [Acidobacteriota bacterium]REK15441.1 MAG: bifunctional diaminohydroxyphosphoribosylaminopyrimidine deaminase/5-amino-6-(5-phosphoribosylamino)uracil reductase RibD [Acidobacteriota bacterium]REK45792.1 MA